MPVICPYLIAADGAWRSARPSREHHCGAVTPATPLALDKQRRLCLVKVHATCATHLAALATARTLAADDDHADRGGSAASSKVNGATRWSLVRTVPVVLDDPGRGSPRGPGPKRAGQWALGGLMALALGAVVLARLPDAAPTASGSPAVLGATGQPAAALSTTTPRPRGVVAMPSPSAATPTPSARRSARPSPSVTPVPSPSPATVHVVAPGETLFALARAYGTTVEALQAANGLGASTTLQIGQELKLP